MASHEYTKNGKNLQSIQMQCLDGKLFCVVDDFMTLLRTCMNDQERK